MTVVCSFGGGPGLYFDWATLRTHVPTCVSGCASAGTDHSAMRLTTTATAPTSRTDAPLLLMTASFIHGKSNEPRLRNQKGETGMPGHCSRRRRRAPKNVTVGGDEPARGRPQRETNNKGDGLSTIPLSR